MLHKSIRWRIQLWHGALLACLVTGMMGLFFAYIRAEKIRVVDEQLNALITPLMPRLLPPHGGPDFDPHRPPPDEDGPPPRRSDEPIRGFENGPYYYAAWHPNSELVARSSNAPPVAAPRPGPNQHRFIRVRGDYRELVMMNPEGAIVLVGFPLAQIQAQLRSLALELTIAGAGIVLFGLAGGWWVAGHTLRPIDAISATAVEIAKGDRSKRINLEETDSELGQMAAVLNHTFDRLDHAFAQQVQFTTDASHELRTPVSVILTQAQLALGRERAPAEYVESLKVCQRAAERMRALVNSLLELARIDADSEGLHFEDCDLARVADEAFELVAPLASEKDAVMRSSIEPVRVKVDRAKMEQVIVNLLQNALQHNAKGVDVRLAVQPKEGYALLTVSDNGKGIPAEAIPQLFDRFYRVDKSRASATGGSGLGLAICKAIVQAHAGSISVESQPGKGATFSIILPMTPPSS